MHEFAEFTAKQLSKMVEMVRGNLNTLQRTMMGALTVIDVHARDVVDNMIRLSVSNINDFEWTRQLRYYWDTEVENCVIRQTNTRFVYGYEYLG